MENKRSFHTKSFIEKQEFVKKIFNSLHTTEEKYAKLIEFGKDIPPMHSSLKVSDNIVKGCQSIMYLNTCLKNELLYFEASSEALISLGLSALLITVYSGETPETVIKSPPLFIEEIGIRATLTPGRSNGLSSMYLRMQQDALKFLVNTPNN